jgi:hypothetical protein
MPALSEDHIAAAVDAYDAELDRLAKMNLPIATEQDFDARLLEVKTAAMWAAFAAIEDLGLVIATRAATDWMIEAGREQMPVEQRIRVENGRIHIDALNQSECVSPAEVYRAMIDAKDLP